jgi:predicted ATPase/DNA-binding CsgD family transcriptional regulator
MLLDRLNTAEGLTPHTGDLPASISSFVGRTREIETLRALLRRDDIRLVTLTGAGGSGKTRLAVEVAQGLARDFADGVRFVGLAALSDSGLVSGTITAALGLQLPADGSPEDSLIEFLRPRQVLLLLDNFEQLLPSASLVYRLLAACPQLKVLVTSRTVLRLSGEHGYAVGPLRVPADVVAEDWESLAGYEAVALFVERAQAVQYDFRLSADNVSAVAEICRRVDGLPLALELAAARSKLLSPQALLARLEPRLPMLTGGARDLPQRQQALRDTIALSYDLLTPDEQRLFRRLAVFAGGWSLEALVVMGDQEWGLGNDGRTPSIEALDLLTALVDWSLVQRGETDDGVPRFGMLETIREFATEQLERSGEAPAIRHRHARYFLLLAERSTQPTHAAFAQGLVLLDRDLDNLRSVLGWCLDTPGQAETGMRLAVTLARRYWQLCGGLREGRAWLERALATPPDIAAPLLAEAHLRLGDIAEFQGDYGMARASLERSLVFWRRQPADRRLASCLRILARVVASQRDLDTARQLAEEALTVAVRQGVVEEEATAHNVLATVSFRQGDPPAGVAHLEEGLRLAREMAAPSLIALFLVNLGWAVDGQGNPTQAHTLFEQALTTAERAGDRREAVRARTGLSIVAIEQQQEAQAEALAEAALTDLRRSGTAQDRARVLSLLALLHCRRDDQPAAVALYAESLDALHVAGNRDALAVAMLQLAAASSGTRAVLVEEAVADTLVRIAADLITHQALERAARLIGIAASIRWTAGRPPSKEVKEVAVLIRASAVHARAAIGEEAYATALAEGRALPLAEGIAQAVAAAMDVGRPQGTAWPAQEQLRMRSSSPQSLTVRESEIAGLITTGMSNAQIATELVLSERTVERHISNIYSKLGVRGRAARASVATYAVQQGLLVVSQQPLHAAAQVPGTGAAE